MMKLVVTEMPDTPRDCLFSERDVRGGRDFYVCNLRGYIPEADELDNGYKPRCVCRGCSKCDKLEVLK